jgi:hypothetical protein
MYRPVYYLCIRLLFIWSIGIEALANTDYVCLDACIKHEEKKSSCLLKCTYDDSSSRTIKPSVSSNPSCLQTCIKNGGQSAVCVPQCTTLSSSLATSPLPAAKSPSFATHQLLKPPLPNKELLLPKHSPPSHSTSINYTCLNLCLQGKLQYSLCSQRCEIKSSPFSSHKP